MTLPNFFIIGAPKAGTTSLYHYLKSHPQIFLSSLKESYFFCRDKCKQPESLRAFESFFDDVTEEKAVGEACASYIFNDHACQNISDLLPDSKLIVILRDPAQRAFSEYLMNYRTGHVKFHSEERVEESFLEYLKEDKANYFYFESLKNYMRSFREEQIKILLFEDLKNNPRKVVQDCCEFLGVDPSVEFELANKIYNKGGMPKNASIFLALESLRRSYRTHLVNLLPAALYSTLRSFYSTIRSMNMRSQYPKLSLEGRRQVIEIHREDTLRLQELLRRDLTAWLEV